MKKYLKAITILFFCLLIPLHRLQAEGRPSNPEIDYLMRLVETSPCRFFRNNKEYDGPQALEHILLKYKHYKGNIVTAEDFIASCATKSLMSGKEYTLQCTDQSPMPLAEWLHAQLDTYRKAESE